MFIGFNLGLPADASDRPAGHAAPHLHLRRQAGWDIAQSHHLDRQFPVRVGVLLLLINVLSSLRARAPRPGRNPWDAPTLEWSRVLAAAALQFRGDSDRRLAAIRCGRISWDETRGPLLAGSAACCSDRGKETIGTTALDGEPDMMLEMPEDSIAPFCAGGWAGGAVRRPAAETWALVAIGGAVICRWRCSPGSGRGVDCASGRPPHG